MCNTFVFFSFFLLVEHESGPALMTRGNTVSWVHLPEGREGAHPHEGAEQVFPHSDEVPQHTNWMGRLIAQDQALGTVYKGPFTYYVSH